MSELLIEFALQAVNNFRLVFKCCQLYQRLSILRNAGSFRDQVVVKSGCAFADEPIHLLDIRIVQQFVSDLPCCLQGRRDRALG